LQRVLVYDVKIKDAKNFGNLMDQIEDYKIKGESVRCLEKIMNFSMKIEENGSTLTWVQSESDQDLITELYDNNTEGFKIGIYSVEITSFRNNCPFDIQLLFGCLGSKIQISLEKNKNQKLAEGLIYQYVGSTKTFSSRCVLNVEKIKGILFSLPYGNADNSIPDKLKRQSCFYCIRQGGEIWLLLIKNALQILKVLGRAPLEIDLAQAQMLFMKICCARPDMCKLKGFVCVEDEALIAFSGLLDNLIQDCCYVTGTQENFLNARCCTTESLSTLADFIKVGKDATVTCNLSISYLLTKLPIGIKPLEAKT
jgi:hypothetical protein